MADLYEIAFPRHCGRIYSTYSSLIRKGGKLINAAYTNAVHDREGLPAALNLPQSFLLRKLGEYLDQEQPQLIITTYSLAARLISDYLRERGLATPLVTCITDVGIHNVWLNDNTTLYLAACADTRRALLARGVAAEKIAVSGIPVKKSFDAIPRVIKEGRQRELLIIGGGLGMLPEQRKFYERLNGISDTHTTVVCGQNAKLRQKLESRGFANITVLGCSDNIPQLMAKADLLLTKPGGISTFEAIHARLPLLIFPPSMEQETHNRDFILGQGIGQLLNEAEATATQVESLIKNEARLAEMRRHMQELLDGFDTEALIKLIRRHAAAGETEERRSYSCLCC